MSQQALELFAKLYAENGNSIDFDFEYGPYEIVEEGDWEDDGKYQHTSHIVKFMDVLISVNENRTGSHYSDWYYGDVTISLCERREEVKVVVTYHNVGPTIEVPSRD